jgi:hypothetical protein
VSVGQVRVLVPDAIGALASWSIRADRSKGLPGQSLWVRSGRREVAILAAARCGATHVRGCLQLEVDVPAGAEVTLRLPLEPVFTLAGGKGLLDESREVEC